MVSRRQFPGDTHSWPGYLDLKSSVYSESKNKEGSLTVLVSCLLESAFCGVGSDSATHVCSTIRALLAWSLESSLAPGAAPTHSSPALSASSYCCLCARSALGTEARSFHPAPRQLSCHSLSQAWPTCRQGPALPERLCVPVATVCVSAFPALHKILERGKGQHC